MADKTLPSAVIEAHHHDVYPFIDSKHNLKDAAVGTTVLITGAGTGIGVGIAEAFALAGAPTLNLAARRTAPLEQTRQSIASLVPNCQVLVSGDIDISDEISATKLFSSLETVPNIVVSNAGVSSGTAIVADADPSTWWRDYNIHLRGSFLVARAYIRAVRESERKRGGLLINASSMAPYFVMSGRSAYDGSKAALNKLSEHIDLEGQQEGGSGVRSIAIHPGGVMTPLVTPDIPKEVLAHLIDTVQLPGELAVYFSTKRAKVLMGRYVSANWDMEALEKAKEQVVEGDLLKLVVTGIGL